jgi:uncharacterized protein YfaS (alpha-2-macroglobulin family)
MKFLVRKIEIPMTKSSLTVFVVLILFFITTILSGQKSTNQIKSVKTESAKQSFNNPTMRPVIGSIEDYIESHKEHPYEKVFLHADRQTYLQNDTIWFKAYLWYGDEQQPDTVSGILYVDLINSNGIVMQKRRLLIQNGTSHGDFCLDTTIIPGEYLLRAYT